MLRLTVLTPVKRIALLQSTVAETGLSREHSLAQVDQGLSTGAAHHVSLGDQLTGVLGWAVASWDFLLLKLMHMRGVGLVALHAKGEVVTLGAVEAKHVLLDGFEAAITNIPHVEAVLFDELLLSSLISYLLHLLAKFVFKGGWLDLLSFSISFFLFDLISKKFEILMPGSLNRLLLLTLINLILIVLLTKHATHRFVIEVWNEL